MSIPPRDVIDRAIEAMQEVEWGGEFIRVGEPYSVVASCPVCGCPQPHHDDKCNLRASLTELRKVRERAVEGWASKDLHGWVSGDGLGDPFNSANPNLVPALLIPTEEPNP